MNKNPRSTFAVDFGRRTGHFNCSHNLCTCGKTKKAHFKNALEHVFKAGNVKNGPVKEN